MPCFEYVNKSEWKPLKAEANVVIMRVKAFIRKYYPDLDFTYGLVGSGKNNLITREVGGNRGFDFDYNFYIPADHLWRVSARDVHYAFMNAIRYAVRGSLFDDPEESTSVFTIKYKDKKGKRIICSCDFAIVCHDGLGNFYYLHDYKESGGFGMSVRSFRFDVEDRVSEIVRRCPGGWNRIRDEYLKLKNADRQNKRSFVLYVEAVNNVYNGVFYGISPVDQFLSLASGGINYPSAFWRP